MHTIAGARGRGAVRSLAAGALAALLVACGASRPTAAESAAAQTADTVCTLLRDWNNDLGDSLNATSRAITDDDDPTTADEALQEGFDELVELAEARRDQLDQLDLPAVPDREALLAELAEGADESIARLESERDDIAELEPITVDRQAGALGGAFVALEGALSDLEPQVGSYRADLRAAFVADEGCRHVIQPLGADG